MHENGWQLNPQLAWREIDGSVFVISPADSMVHEMNPTASFIWKQMERGRGFAEIARALEAEFEISASEAENDMREFLASLEKKCLLTRGDSRGEDAGGKGFAANA